MSTDGNGGTARAGRRLVPGPVLSVVLLIPLAAVVWLQAANPFGDEGMINVLSFILVVLDLSILGLWFLFFSAYPPVRRYGVFLSVALILGTAATLFRLEGFSGAMVPTFVPRFGSADRDLGGARAPGAGAVDLTAVTASDFPGFLGARRNATVDGVRLARDWQAEPPQLLWREDVGAGWSGFAVVGGVALTMEQWGEDEVVTARDVETGASLWSRAWPGHFDHFLGGEGPRSTPTIDGGRVYALGARGRLVCLAGADGSVLWQKDLLTEFGVSAEDEFREVAYGRSNSPLVVGQRLIVPAGGVDGGRMAGLVAYDKQSGELLWESAPRHVSFSSPALATLAGVEQVLIVNEDTASGHDPEDGRMLWEHPWPGVTNATASASQAVAVAPDRVFLSKGYGGGATLLQLVAGEDGTLTAHVLWRSRRAMKTKLTNVVVHEGHVYGLSDGILECIDLETGRRVWKGGRYGHGQVLLVGELLIVISEEGEVLLIEPRPDVENAVLGRFQALEGKTWNNPALYGDLLVVRNGREAAVYRLPLADA